MAIEIKDENIFGKVIADALSAVENNRQITSGERYRWINAINNAVKKLGDLSYQIEWMPETKHLLVWSDSNEIYEANGECQCRAFEFGQPCWHRALAKLIKNYLAAVEPPKSKAAGATFTRIENAPYLKPGTDAKPKTVGNIRI